jgi:hypothetical protein
MDRILTNGRKVLTSNNNKLLVSRERTTGQRSGLKLDGSTNKITIPAQTLTDFTFATWFNKSASKVSSFLSNSGTNVLGLNASNQLTFNGLTASISYSIHKTWNYLVVTREAGVVKVSLNKAAFVTIGTDSTSITVNEMGNLFDGRMEAPALFNIANGAHKPHNYLESTVPNLIEQWKLNEGTDTTVYGTKGNNGTVTGAVTWTTPSLMNWVGKHCKFDGKTNYVNFDVTKGINRPVTAWAYECWYKKTGVQAAKGLHFSLHGQNCYVNISADIRFDIAGVGASTSGGGCNDGNWHHLACVFGIDRHLKVYVDGILRGTSSNPITWSNLIFTEFAIGQNPKSLFDSAVAWSIDEARLWLGTERTQTQIQENMNRTLGREPGLVLNLGFESDYYDASGYGNHGTPVGSPVLEVTDNDKLLLNAPIN